MHVAHRLLKLIGWGALLVGLVALVGCRQIAVPLRLSAVESPPGAPPGSLPGVATGFGVSSGAIALGAHRTVGQPVVSGNLAVFPIYAKKQPDLGRFTTLSGNAAIRPCALPVPAWASGPVQTG